MRDLFRIKVIKEIASACKKRRSIWRQLGFELALNISDLNIIQQNEKTCVESRCSAMLELWLRRQPGASWEELREALEAVELDRLAQMIDNWLLPTEVPSGHTDDANSTSHTDYANIGILC